MAITFLKLRDVLKNRAKSKSAHYLDIQNGLCTKPVSTGARSVAWPENEIETLNAALLKGLSEEEIRLLVKKLEFQRKNIEVE